MCLDGVVPTSLSYPVHERTLPNGLRVVVSPDHSVPVVAVNLWYAVGSRDEEPQRTGLAHLFEHVMFQGSEHVASGDHFDSLQAAGATGNATTWFDRTNYYETVPVGALDLALWLEADRMGHLLPALNQANLDNQRDVVKEEKRQRYDNAPYGDSIEHMLALVFPPDHPYGHSVIGSMADLDAASLADTHAFFTRWYAPGNAVLTLAGDVDADDALARAERWFGHLPAREVPVRGDVEPLPPLDGVPRRVATGAVPENTLTLVWRTPPRGTRAHDACELALRVLGGTETSRLHRALVRDHELCSTVGAAPIGLAVGNSIALATAHPREGVALDVVEDALCAELDRLAGSGPTASELARVHTQLEREWLEECAHLDRRADLLGAHAVLDGDPTRVNRRAAEYLSVGADEVTEAVRAWLRPSQRGVLEYRRTTGQEDLA